jgi:hypothetical protein
VKSGREKVSRTELAAQCKQQGMVELAKPEFTPELKFRGSEFEKSSIKVRSK